MTAYHGGFNAGENEAEAVNLAGSSWWPFGAAARQRYRRWRREWSTEPGGTAPRPDTGFLQYERLLVTTALERRRRRG